MENRNAKTFVKIVEAGSFTKAAELLGYSQAAVTAQIKSMEKELGVPLFDRIGKRVYLTHEGKTFLPYALNMLRAEEEAVNSIGHDGPLTGSLSICAPSSYADHVLPGIVLKYSELHPGVFISVRTSDYVDDAARRLARGEIDFLVRLDEENSDPDFLTFASKPEPLIFVTYPGNPLLKKEGLSISEAVSDQFITSTREIGYSAILEKKLFRMGIDLEPVMDIGSVEAIIRILRGGYGVALLPEYVAADYIDNDELIKVQVKDHGLSMNSYYLCSKDRWINPVMSEFIRIVTLNEKH
ncbi:MAG: LysR family transcriptional regulator [Mogibacterium sp.]|nr:LysR family transcriptional regulator [Mogibacterium sp.]